MCLRRIPAFAPSLSTKHRLFGVPVAQLNLQQSARTAGPLARTTPYDATSNMVACKEQSVYVCGAFDGTRARSVMDCDTADAGFLNARQEAFCRAFVAGGSAVADPDAIDPNSDAAMERELAGPYGDRLARMLVSVGECRSNGQADAPTSEKPPP